MEGDDHTDKVGANEWGVFSQSLWRGIAPIPRWRTRLDRVPSPTALRWQTGEIPLSDGWIRQVRDVGTMAGSRHRMVRTLASLWRTYQGSLPCTRCWLPCARTTRPVFGWIRGVSCSARPWIELRAKNTLDGFHHSDASYQAVYPREMNCVPGYPWCAETHIWGKVGRDKP